MKKHDKSFGTLLSFNDKEIVIVTELPIDLDKAIKEGWHTLIFVGEASVRRNDLTGRMLHRSRRVPMYKLMKKKANHL